MVAVASATTPIDSAGQARDASCVHSWQGPSRRAIKADWGDRWSSRHNIAGGGNAVLEVQEQGQRLTPTRQVVPIYRRPHHRDHRDAVTGLPSPTESAQRSQTRNADYGCQRLGNGIRSTEVRAAVASSCGSHQVLGAAPLYAVQSQRAAAFARDNATPARVGGRSGKQGACLAPNVVSTMITLAIRSRPRAPISCPGRLAAWACSPNRP